MAGRDLDLGHAPPQEYGEYEAQEAGQGDEHVGDEVREGRVRVPHHARHPARHARRRCVPGGRGWAPAPAPVGAGCEGITMAAGGGGGGARLCAEACGPRTNPGGALPLLPPLPPPKAVCAACLEFGMDVNYLFLNQPCVGWIGVILLSLCRGFTA